MGSIEATPLFPPPPPPPLVHQYHITSAPCAPSLRIVDGQLGVRSQPHRVVSDGTELVTDTSLDVANPISQGYHYLPVCNSWVSNKQLLTIRTELFLLRAMFLMVTSVASHVPHGHICCEPCSSWSYLLQAMFLMVISVVSHVPHGHICCKPCALIQCKSKAITSEHDTTITALS